MPWLVNEIKHNFIHSIEPKEVITNNRIFHCYQSKMMFKEVFRDNSMKRSLSNDRTMLIPMKYNTVSNTSTTFRDDWKDFSRSCNWSVGYNIFTSVFCCRVVCERRSWRFSKRTVSNWTLNTFTVIYIIYTARADKMSPHSKEWNEAKNITEMPKLQPNYCLKHTKNK